MASDARRLFQIRTTKDYFPWAAILMIVAAAVVCLNLQGRSWWCPAGDLAFSSWDIWTQHNSQHFLDPYSFTHVLHGILEFWLLNMLFGWLPAKFPRISGLKLSVGWRLVMALAFEASWEVAENTDYIINKYREETISLSYFGDSILNSMSDIVCCALGFLLGYRLRFIYSAMLFLATELMLILWIHDSLIINIIMLIYPIPALREWQMPS
jgi:hypothetical protein